MTALDKWAEFLAARLGEREALAGGPREWHVDHHDCSAPFFQCEQPCDEAGWCAEGRCRHCAIEGGDDGMRIYDEGGHDQADAAHIAANDPSWVLADVASKRAILARCQMVLHSFGGREGGEWPDVTRRERTHAQQVIEDLCEPWSSHPDWPGAEESTADDRPAGLRAVRASNEVR